MFFIAMLSLLPGKRSNKLLQVKKQRRQKLFSALTICYNTINRFSGNTGNNQQRIFVQLIEALFQKNMKLTAGWLLCPASHRKPDILK